MSPRDWAMWFCGFGSGTAGLAVALVDGWRESAIALVTVLSILIGVAIFALTYGILSRRGKKQ